MNAILIIGITAIIIVAGVVVADITEDTNGIPSDAMATKYNYQFILNISGGDCDLHYLRPRLYYELGIYPDQMTITYPNLILGWYEPLDKGNETLLNLIMTNDTLVEEVCHYPSEVYFEYKTRIHPESFTTLTLTRALEKPIYYADERGYVTILVKQNLTEAEQAVFENQLCNMWEKVKK